MSGDVHAGFCERRRVRLPPATHPIVHCATEEQAERLLEAIGNRMAEVGLQLNPAKTRIVYCKDGRRRLDYEHTSFTYLGFTFRARGARTRHGVNFTGFLPAVSKDALNKMSREVRHWRLHLLTGHTLADLEPGQLGRYLGHPLLRRVLPNRPGSPPTAHQRLPGALAPTEISTAQASQEGPGLLAAHHPPTARPLRPLGMDSRLLVTKTTRAG